MKFFVSRRGHLAAFATLAIVAAASLVGCGKPAAQQAPPPPEVTVLTVAPRMVTLSFEYPGRIEGSREVEVRPRVSGILLHRLYDEGASVKQGQALFQIDPAPYAAEAQAAEANLAEARARVAKADREMARIEPLTQAHAVSQREHDAAVAEVEQSRAAAGSAEARLAKAKLDLGWTKVDAPIAGVTSRAPFSEGSLVGPESLLTRISQVRPIWVRFSISDQELLALRVSIAAGTVDAPPLDRREVELVLAGGAVVKERGRVNFSDSIIDAQTGSIDLRAEFANPEGTLVPGQFVRVRLLGLERPAAIVIPQRAVQQGQKGKYVYLVGAEDKAEIRPIEIGPWVGDDWVIEKGLAAGDRVVVDGTVKVRPGAPVRVAPDAPAAPGGPPAGSTSNSGQG